jgi:hypothetical protein
MVSKNRLTQNTEGTDSKDEHKFESSGAKTYQGIRKSSISVKRKEKNKVFLHTKKYTEVHHAIIRAALREKAMLKRVLGLDTYTRNKREM